MANSGSGGSKINGKAVLVGILALLVVVLAIANSNKVKVDFVLGDVQMPLFLVIIGSALIGWVIGWFMGRSRD